MIGKNIDKILITTDVPVSTVASTGFAIPPVVAVDVSLVAADDVCMAAAVPPPAIIANAQVVVGSNPAMVDTITAVPAMVANGMAIESKILSNQGIKYAKISTTVATPSIKIAVVLPTQFHDSFKGIIP